MFCSIYSTSRPDVKCLPSLLKHYTCDSSITNTGYNTCQNFTLSSSMGVNCGIMLHIFAYNPSSYKRVSNRASKRRGERRITNMSAVTTCARLSSNTSRLVVPVYGEFTNKFYWVIVHRRLTERPIKRQHSDYIHDHSDYWRNDIPSLYNTYLTQTICRYWHYIAKQWNNYKLLAKINTRYATWFRLYSCKERKESTEGEMA